MKLAEKQAIQSMVALGQIAGQLHFKKFKTPLHLFQYFKGEFKRRNLLENESFRDETNYKRSKRHKIVMDFNAPFLEFTFRQTSAMCELEIYEGYTSRVIFDSALKDVNNDVTKIVKEINRHIDLFYKRL